jgi:S1-C subfamily serine protease
MKRVPLYSRANAAPGLARPEDPPSAGPPPPPQAVVGEARVRRPGVLRRFASGHDRPLLVAAGAALAAVAIFSLQRGGPAPKALTQADIDKAVLHTLSTKQLPSPAAKAAEIIGPAVVRVRGISPGERGDPDLEEGVGTGVVIVDTGVVLTNLHVVTGSEKVRVEFADGHEADAAVISTKAEHDLAVLQAKSLPKDGVTAATLRSTAELKPGDQVVAVGFPFGIGPSVSSGVISGLQREFRSPQGKRVLTNLIQFDAAANPGNSGGPLVTMDGEVVGIVTAILNPSRERTFIGIGFAVPIENAASGVGMHPF